MTTGRMFGMCGLLLAAAAAAQEPKVEPKASSAQPGELLPSPFRAYVVVDTRYPGKVNPPATPDDRDPKDRTHKMHDLVTDNGLSPVVAVFVRADPKDLGADSGVVKLAKAVNKIIPDYRADKLAAFVSFLRVEGMPKAVTLTEADKTQTTVELDAEYPDDEKRDVYADQIDTLAKAAAARSVVWTLAPVKSKATDAWGLKAEDEVTVVVYSNRLRVFKRWAFKADGPTDDQVKEITDAVEEMITGVAKKK